MTDNPREGMERIVDTIEEGLGVPRLFARVLVSRGVTNLSHAEELLYPKLDNLSDPFLLPDITKGIERFIKAISEGERICLYGDYDADGITSTCLMYNFLGQLNINPYIYLPKRIEGYGLNKRAIETIKREGVSLLICLDCGSSNVEEVEIAKRMGIETVIIDHHELPDKMPDAYAIINPKRRDSSFPTRELAACGVVFFFLWGLRRVMYQRGLLKKRINLKRELDLVTIATFGDMVPLTKDNRIIVRHGVDMMRHHPRQWLRSFFRKNMITKSGLDEFALNFVIIPRINASGRVSDPILSFNFLTSNEEATSHRLLMELTEANSLRQKMGDATLKEAIERIDSKGLQHRKSIVLFDRAWHLGVLGIVAQRLAEIYRRPAIVITEVDGICKGSGRGCDGVDLYATISDLSHLLLRHGGHRYACGISILRENLPAFEDAFEENLAYFDMTGQKMIPIDAEATFDELTGEFMECIELLSPFGLGNPRPLLLFEPESISLTGNGRMRVIDKEGRTWYGHISGQETFNEGGSATTGRLIAATPYLKEEMGDRFINLHIKAVLDG